MWPFRKGPKPYNVWRDEACTDMSRSLMGVTGASYRLLAAKSDEGRAEILEWATGLAEKITETLEHETPLVLALTLLIAAREHEVSIRAQL